ncbi:hypothetical protein TYRP_017202 [Tyrophagus putrescentiae]|nr:hypothetical protein TYRP_017202 [Tyrophagus putrescentiae]
MAFTELTESSRFHCQSRPKAGAFCPAGLGSTALTKKDRLRIGPKAGVMQGAHWAADQLNIRSNACRVDNLVAAGLYALNSNGGTWSGETVPGNDHVLHRVCSEG